MRVDWVVIALSLCSAFAFAVSTTLKHVSATQVPEVYELRAGVLGRFVQATLSHPLWLIGIAADAIGLTLQILALHFGALAVVQPLLVSGLLFSLLMRRRERWHLSSHELLWAFVLTVCLVGLLSLSGMATAQHRQGADRFPAVIAAVVGVLIAIVCVVLARRLRPSASSSALMGIAVGVVYAATAALLKGVSDVAVRGGVAVLESWQLYAVLIIGGVGLILTQLAFQSGPLTASLPAIATVDPLLSIVVGVLIYDEHIHRGPWAGAGLLALMLLLATSVVELGKVDVDAPDAPDVADPPDMADSPALGAPTLGAPTLGAPSRIEQLSGR
jgi:drug/metabolite transporter (DMT)-like permease